MSVEAYLRAAPKVELHVHLEGAIRPATLLTLAERNGVALPATTEPGLREWFRFRDFPHFAEIYGIISRCLRTAEDYELIVHEFGAELARQNCRYAEVTFSPCTHWVAGVPEAAFLDGIERGRERVRAEFGVELNWVFDIVRWAGSEARTRERAAYTTDLAIARKEHGVVALGLGGIEAGNPPEPFAPFFSRARAAGLHSAPHAGEFGGPESVTGALEALEADWIGHGVVAIEDAELVERLAENGVPLEVCPTSNVCLGAYANLAEHPLPALHAAGVTVTVNSDDPPLFDTTLTAEVLLLHTAFGFDLDTIDKILLSAVRHSFLPHGRREVLETEFRAEMGRLKEEFQLLP